MFKSWNKVKKVKHIYADGGKEIMKANEEIEKIYQNCRRECGKIINSDTQEFYETQMGILKGTKSRIKSEWDKIEREWKV